MTSEPLELAFYAVSGGAILYVIGEVWNGMRRYGYRELGPRCSPSASSSAWPPTWSSPTAAAESNISRPGPLGYLEPVKPSAPETIEVWREPVRGSYADRRLIALPGRERLEGWRQGLFPPPPLSHLTGARPTGFGSGTADAEMPASRWLAASTG